MSDCPGSRPDPRSTAARRYTRHGGAVAVLRTALLISLPIVIWGADSSAPLLAQPAPAQRISDSTAFSLDLPAASLPNALSQLAAATGAFLSVDGALTAGKQAPALRGRMSVRQALDRLLQGSGLEAHASGGRYFIYAIPERRSTVASLSAVKVTGNANNVKDEAYRAPQSVNVLTRDDIERFRGTSVGDIFQGIPGVLVGENRNSGGLDVNIRGMQGQGRVPVLIDGARQETTVYRGYSGVASRSYIDPDLIGGIRIEKGPSMSAQGTGAVGGLVMARTLNAEDIVEAGNTFGIRLRGTAIGNNSGSPVTPGTTSGYTVGRELHTNCAPGSEAACQGAYDVNGIIGASGDSTLERPDTFTPKSWSSSIALGLRLEHIDLVAAYATRRQGNYYAGKHGPAPEIDLSNTAPGRFNLWTNVYPTMSGASRFRAEELVVNSNYESQSSLLKAQIRLPADQELELSWLRYHSKYGELMPSQLIWLGRIAQTDSSEVTANTYNSRYRWRPQGNPYLDVTASLWHTDTKSINRGYADADGTSSSVSSFMSKGQEHYRRTGADLSNTMLFDGWGNIEVRYGLSLQRELLGNDGDDSDSGTGRNGNRSEYSGFIALKVQPAPSLTLDAGLRYTRYAAHDNNPTQACASDVQSDESGRIITRCETVQVGKVRHSGSAPILSLTWEFAPDWQAYARYAEALRMPSLFESTGGQSFGTVVGSNLRPEHARNREFGLTFMRDGVFKESDTLRMKVSYFRNDMSDYLTRTMSNASENIGTSSTFRMRNVDSARFAGFEVSGSYDAGMFFTEFGVTRYNNIEICHRGSYRREACTDYGVTASYINNMIPPNWHGSVTLGARLFDRRLTVGMRGTLMGPRNHLPEYDNQGVDSIFATPVQWHKYKVFDLFASYKVNDHVSVDFNIDNLTDRYYLDALGLGPVPAPGRTARLGVTLQF